jgi:hypothetical protein
VEQTAQMTTNAQDTITKSSPPQNIQQKLESQLSEEQLTIPGNQSTVTSTASTVRRAKKKIILEVLNVAFAEGTNQPVRLFRISPYILI